MTDVPPLHGGHDEQDNELARQLAVEPLDELTRRRLVARALDETAPVSDSTRAGRSRFPFVAAAAAMVVVLVVGLGVLVSTRDDNSGSENQALQEAPATDSKREAAGLPPSTGDNSVALTPSAREGATGGASVDDSGALTTSAPPALGEFGDLSTASARRRLRAAIATVPPDQATALSGQSTAFGSSASAQDTCKTFPDVVATATGTFGDRTARVVVTRRANGSLRVRAVLVDSCEVRGLPSP